VRSIFGWVLLAMAASLVALGVWDIPQPAGPPFPDEQGLLAAAPRWYLQAGYLAAALALTAAGAWLLLRSPRRGGGA
jgi:hypothetical protein